LTHVVMVVTNDVSIDTRVKKEALAVARTGLRVTVLGITTEKHRSASMLGPVRIIRVPVSYVLRDRRARRRARLRQAWPPVVGFRSDADKAAAARRLQLRESAVKERTGWALERRRPGLRHAAAFKADVLLRRAMLLGVKGGRVAFRARIEAGKRGSARLRAAWQSFDAIMSRTTLGARWRSVVPEVVDYEHALGPVLDELRPDVIHAHDMQVVGIAAKASARARHAGRQVPWIYDAHEYVPGLSQYGGRTPRVIAAWANLEREYIGSASHVITVSPAIADALREKYGLAKRPAVVLNTPISDPPGAGRPSVRVAVGLPDEIPLVVYSGVVQHARGVHTAVEAMTILPEAHLVVVCVPHNDTWAVRQIRPLPEKLGVSDRVHFINPVPPGEVIEFLRSADVGLLPILHFPSHEMALANKLFEYLNAGIPVVVSDCRTQAEFVQEHGVGEVFPAEDVKAMVAAIRRVLDDYPRYANNVADPALLDRYSWARQEEVLRGVYSEVIGRKLTWTENRGVGQLLDLMERPDVECPAVVGPPVR
jgi:glycosyltransferase involved in cell wall biosynthesis